MTQQKKKKTPAEKNPSGRRAERRAPKRDAALFFPSFFFFFSPLDTIWPTESAPETTARHPGARRSDQAPGRDYEVGLEVVVELLDRTEPLVNLETAQCCVVDACFRSRLNRVLGLQTRRPPNAVFVVLRPRTSDKVARCRKQQTLPVNNSGSRVKRLRKRLGGELV